MKLRTEELLALLDELKSRIQTGDSSEGALTYVTLGSGEWEVSGSYFVGDGKGGFRILHWSKEMISNNNDLLARYRLTRDTLLDALGYDSTLDKSSRMAAVRAHLDLLDLIKQRFPECQHVHSTAEWYLNAQVPDQPASTRPEDILAKLRAKIK